MGAEKPVVLGQSLGGAVALAWATEARANISALVIVLGVSHPWSTGLEMFYKLTSYTPLSWLIIPMLSAFATENAINQSLVEVFEPQEIPNGYRENVGVELVLKRKTIRSNARQRRFLKPQIIPMVQNYGSLNLPVEIIHGTEDILVPATLHSVKLANDVANAKSDAS